MRLAVVLVIALAVGIAHSYNVEGLPELKESKNPLSYWEVIADADPEGEITFLLALKQKNIDKLTARLMEISHPHNKDYGKWMTKEQVLDLVAPAADVSHRIVKHVEGVCSSESLLEINNYRDAIKVRTTARCAELLFGITLATWKHTKSDRFVVRMSPSSAPITVPAIMEEHIEIVEGLINLPIIKQRKALRLENAPAGPELLYIIPDTIRRLYNIPSSASVITNSGVSQSTVEFLPEGAPLFSDQVSFAQQAGETFTNYSKIIGPFYQGDSEGESVLDTEYLFTLAPKGDNYYITYDAWTLQFATDLFNMQNPPLVNSVSYGWPEARTCSSVTNATCNKLGPKVYVQRSNAEFAKVASIGVSILIADQDEGAPSEANEDCSLDTTHPLWPIYPAASPFVTAVSSTTLIESPTSDAPLVSALPPICNVGYTCSQTGTLEVPCNITNTYYNYTTGGGFSNFAGQESYQTAAVQAYLTSGVTLPPAKFFNASGRAYPDVAALGARILIVFNGAVSVTEGTSAATPIFAAVISLLNNWRLNNGKAALGFLNPLLYQMAADAPQAFNDITVGTNRCTIDTCCRYGYQATKGWDPVTGLGTPNFQEMLNYIMTLA